MLSSETFLNNLKFTIMAYNISFNEQTGKHSFFSVKEKAWHGLGQIVAGYPTSAEALKFAGLDYTVEKRKLFTFDNSNDILNDVTCIKIPKIPVPNYFATIRTDNENVLGVVGKDYEVAQNTDAFNFLISLWVVMEFSMKPLGLWEREKGFSSLQSCLITSRWVVTI